MNKKALKHKYLSKFLSFINPIPKSDDPLDKFLSVVLLIFYVLIVIPIIFEAIHYFFPTNPPLNSLRGFVKGAFGSRDNYWNATSSLITALGIFYTLLWQIKEKKEKEKELQNGLNHGVKHEILSNLLTTFSEDKLYLPCENQFYYSLKQNYFVVSELSFLGYIYALYRLNENYDHTVRIAQSESEILKAKELLCFNTLYYLTDEVKILNSDDRAKILSIHSRTENFYKGRSINAEQVEKLRPGEYRKALNQYSEIFNKERDTVFAIISKHIDDTIPCK